MYPQTDHPLAKNVGINESKSAHSLRSLGSSRATPPLGDTHETQQTLRQALRLGDTQQTLKFGDSSPQTAGAVSPFALEFFSEGAVGNAGADRGDSRGGHSSGSGSLQAEPYLVDVWETVPKGHPNPPKPALIELGATSPKKPAIRPPATFAAVGLETEVAVSPPSLGKLLPCKRQQN